MGPLFKGPFIVLLTGLLTRMRPEALEVLVWSVFVYDGISLNGISLRLLRRTLSDRISR